MNLFYIIATLFLLNIESINAIKNNFLTKLKLHKLVAERIFVEEAINAQKILLEEYKDDPADDYFKRTILQNTIEFGEKDLAEIIENLDASIASSLVTNKENSDEITKHENPIEEAEEAEETTSTGASNLRPSHFGISNNLEGKSESLLNEMKIYLKLEKESLELLSKEIHTIFFRRYKFKSYSSSDETDQELLDRKTLRETLYKRLVSKEAESELRWLELDSSNYKIFWNNLSEAELKELNEKNESIIEKIKEVMITIKELKDRISAL